MLHFNEDDLEFAEQMAKLNLYKKKEDEDKGSSCPKYQSKNDVSSKAVPVSGSKLDPKLKFREGKMRIRQIIKLGKDLRDSIEHLEKLSKKKSEKTFRSPLELEKKRKQWEEFALSARRTLYTLKREINLVSLKISAPLIQLPDNTLRLLSSVCRTGHHLLKGLENFAEETKVGHKGHPLLCDSLLAAQQILLVMAVGGVSFPSKSRLSDNYAAFNAHLQSEEDSEILASDLDSEALSLIKPKAVRQKLSLLARSFMMEKRRRPKGKRCKILAPLRQTEAILSEGGSEKGSESTPLTVELDEGRTIQFIEDSLSPKLRRRERRRRVYEDAPVTYLKRSEEKDRSPSPPPAKESEKYDISEKVADAVFEKILPYVATSSREDEYPATPAEFLTNFADLDIYSEAHRRLQLIEERFAEIEAATEDEERFLSRVKEQLSENQDDSFDELRRVITAANAALEKTFELQLFTPASSSLTVPGAEVFSVGVENRIPETELALHSPSLPDAQDELKKQRLEFWQFLADNHYVIPPSNVSEQLRSDPNLQDKPECSKSGNSRALPELVSAPSASKQVAFEPPTKESKDVQVNASDSYGSSFEEEEAEHSGADSKSDKASSHFEKDLKGSEAATSSTSQSRSN